MIRRQLVVMLKDPRPGRVKTRLARDIGPIAATWWVRRQTDRLLRRLRDPRWDLVLAVAPDFSGMASRAWPDDLERVPQGSGDLGARMARVMRSRPPGPVCIVGGDIPGITPAHVARAFAALGRHDAVFGPAPDGGYWLIGMKRTRAVPANVLQGVRWSTRHALADSKATVPDARIGLVDTLRDVDTVDDLRAV